jgi:hypothetical protein
MSEFDEDNINKNNRNNQDYKRHVVLRHAGKLCYPSKADLVKFGIEPKGKEWEI